MYEKAVEGVALSLSCTSKSELDIAEAIKPWGTITAYERPDLILIVARL